MTDIEAGMPCALESGFRSIHISLMFPLQVTRLLSAYLEKYALSPVFTEEEVEHYLMPVEDVVDSYVVESAGQLLQMLLGVSVAFLQSTACKVTGMP